MRLPSTILISQTHFLWTTEQQEKPAQNTLLDGNISLHSPTS